MSPAWEGMESFVRGLFARAELFLSLVRGHGSPLYVIEERTLLERAQAFTAAFRAELPGLDVFFPLKTNNHPFVAAALARAGLGLEVSSGQELLQALKTCAGRILFNGPGKTADELALAVAWPGRVTVLLDSHGELERLERAAAARGVVANAGARLTSDERGLWRKFGVPLAELPALLARARECPHVALGGLQFHTSWNLDPSAQTAFIRRLGAALRPLPPELLGMVGFVDVGGGFWPERGEWTLAADGGRVHLPAAPIEEFARRIGAALREELPGRRALAEPGRWLCEDAAHVLLTVVDRKGDDIAITDGGTNLIGWERFESDYFPVLNLSRPSLSERPFIVLGSLCTPHDVWGRSCHASDVREGDVLLVPSQGAYTHSLRQAFIKPLPRSVIVRADGAAERWEDAP